MHLNLDFFGIKKWNLNKTVFILRYFLKIEFIFTRNNNYGFPKLIYLHVPVNPFCISQNYIIEFIQEILLIITKSNIFYDYNLYKENYLIVDVMQNFINNF